MKAVLAILAALFVATTALAQRPTAACGPGDVQFKVDLVDKPQALPPVAPDKAQVFVIHDSGSTGTLFGYPTTKVAMDGAWVGAGHGETWFAV